MKRRPRIAYGSGSSRQDYPFADEIDSRSPSVPCPEEVTAAIILVDW